jgi:hypothetical protein
MVLIKLIVKQILRFSQYDWTLILFTLGLNFVEMGKIILCYKNKLWKINSKFDMAG